MISENYEQRNFNCTSFSTGNLVDGLPIGCSRFGTPMGGPPLANPWYFATKIKSYLPEVNFGGVRIQKFREDVLIFNFRKYEVVVVGQK